MQQPLDLACSVRPNLPYSGHLPGDPLESPLARFETFPERILFHVSRKFSELSINDLIFLFFLCIHKQPIHVHSDDHDQDRDDDRVDKLRPDAI